jgi:hypothetical protein
LCFCSCAAAQERSCSWLTPAAAGLRRQLLRKSKSRRTYKNSLGLSEGLESLSFYLSCLFCIAFSLLLLLRKSKSRSLFLFLFFLLPERAALLLRQSSCFAKEPKHQSKGYFYFILVYLI